MKNQISGLNNMKVKFSIILILCSICSFATATAQSDQELIAFDIPKSLFFTDEKIWINASSLVAGGASESQVIYAELLDSKNRSWALSKMPLENGHTLNFLQLTEKIPSGNYLLRVFTRISANQQLGDGVQQQLITVLNPSLPPRSTSEGKPVFALPSQSNSILENNYTTEEEVSVNLNVSGETKLSIAAWNPYLEGVKTQFTSQEIYDSKKDVVLLPELFGHIVHAKVAEVDTTRTYFLSAHGEKSALFTDRPDVQGNLYFDLGGFRHWDHLLIQVEDGSTIPDLEMVSPAPKTTFKSSFQIPELQIHPEDAAFLRELKIASALEPYYNQEYRNDSVPVVTGFVADQVYLMDDYTRFETVETVVKEYVPGVAIRRKEKEKEFRVLNQPQNFMFEENPLMMVDALPVFDSDLLAGFNPKYFKKLEVLNREFYLNDRNYAGVISFSSYENNFGLFPVPDQVLYLDYSGVNPFITFQHGFAKAAVQNERIPDFRSVLFWDKVPSRSSFTFSTSKMKGLYEVRILTTDDSGQKKLTKEYFRVD
ncbi:hypothetical protein [Algoriphagus vanfongensis]|uniref:hypothetical protein n=1 Tax=Algoriphagus vanfongensis TaxID=426371 RepID=UPI0012FA5364|nr:hypothetical protein [Algoriphagus vanfongensis]